MSTEVSIERGRLWPVMFGLLGAFNLADYFYKFAFQPDDLLKGFGFLCMVPLPYLFPGVYTRKQNSAHTRPAGWAGWLSFVGLALVIAGFATSWL